jgi:hypothetical protein
VGDADLFVVDRVVEKHRNTLRQPAGKARL